MKTLFIMSQGDLANQGYSQTDRSATELSSETADNQSAILGIFYEFFPLILALFMVFFIRAKFILGMEYIASLKHKTSLTLVTKNALETSPVGSPSFTGTLSSW